MALRSSAGAYRLATAFAMAMLVVAGLLPPSADGQGYLPFNGSTYVSVGPSVTRYFGDLDALPRQSRGMANNLSIGYQIKPALGIGFSLTGNWNVAGHGEGSTLAVMRLGMRTYFKEGRRAPFADLSGLLVVGGPQTGGGAGLAAGYRFAFGRAISVSPILRIDALGPDVASDGTSSGASMDVFANFGVELNLTLPRRRVAPRLVQPRIPDSVATGSPVTFLAEIENWDGNEYGYTWEFGDGSFGKGEVVTHRYAESGLYAGVVIADVGDQRRDAQSFEVRVVDNREDIPSVAVPSSVRSIRIDSIYGSRELVVGEEENFRVRIGRDALWPIRYEWDMGDGVRSVGNNIVHYYRQPGYYRIRVVASNQYGADSTSTIVQVAEPPVSSSATRRPVTSETSPRRAPVVEPPTEPSVTDHEQRIASQYYSWTLESHFDRASAAAALRKYTGRGLDDLRVFVDKSGTGSDAYRVVVGRYETTREAVAVRALVESKSRKKPSLITIQR